jgi:hypothetical protein
VTDDPEDPEYRYPLPGERLWHRSQGWVTVEMGGADLVVLGEVAATRERDGQAVTVKLRSLTEPSGG